MKYRFDPRGALRLALRPAVRLILGAAILASVSSAACRAEEADALRLIARDAGGCGLLCQSQGKTVLFVDGTPEQMGAAHGSLLREKARDLVERVLYLVGGVDTSASGKWFLDRMAEIQRRTLPHIPPRFFAECDALAQAAGVSQRDGRYANLFPERFHCSGVAVRGKATAGGRVLHARVLDYMRDIDLQDAATVTVFMPDGRQCLDEPGLRRLHRHGDGDEREGPGHRRDGRPRRGRLGRHAHELPAARHHGARRHRRRGAGDPRSHAADLRVLLRLQRQVAHHGGRALRRRGR